MAEPWMTYHGVAIWQVPGASAYTYTTDHVEIDADGAPNAYHPGDTGLDALANAGYPNGGWTSVLAVDPNDDTTPYVQTTGPFAGYYVARTSLQDPRLAEIDPQRYVDATAFPYIVFPGHFNALAGTGMPGDFVMAKHLQTGKVSAAVVADIGPATAPLGEISVKLAVDLGGAHPNPRNGHGAPRGPVRYVVFPRSHATPKWRLSFADVQARAAAELTAVGGWIVIDALP